MKTHSGRLILCKGLLRDYKSLISFLAYIKHIALVIADRWNQRLTEPPEVAFGDADRRACNRGSGPQCLTPTAAIPSALTMSSIQSAVLAMVR